MTDFYNLYTHPKKGGLYMRLHTAAAGAGSLNGHEFVVYKDCCTGAVYVRTKAEWAVMSAMGSDMWSHYDRCRQRAVRIVSNEFVLSLMDDGSTHKFCHQKPCDLFEGSARYVPLSIL